MDDSRRALFVRLLNQIRSEFDRLRWQTAPIHAQLVHKATNAEVEGVRGLPPRNGDPVAFQGAGHRDGGQRVDDNGVPVFRPDPIPDAAGTPITNSAGEAFDIVLPAHRTVTFLGQPEDFERLDAIATRAGRIVADMPHYPTMALLSGWSFSTPSDLWWALLFEIAWANRHPLVVAEKRLWLPADEPTALVPYDLEKLNGLSSAGLGLNNSIPRNWLARLPDAWVSDLEDTTAASADTVDYLLSEIGTAPRPAAESEGSTSQEQVPRGDEDVKMPIQRRFAVALSFPGEHRATVKKVALALRNVFGEQRVFYDHFHEVELSRPDLDLVLQRFYADEADLVVVFVSGEYQSKEWCGIEWRAIRELMKSRSRQTEDVMFLRLDDKPLDGMLAIDGFLSIANKSPRSVADSIIKRWTATR